MGNTLAEYVDDAALADFTRKAGEELPTRGAIGVEAQCLGHLGLGELEKAAQLHQVDAEDAVVMPGVAKQPASASCDGNVEAGGRMGRHEQVGAAGHGSHDQPFQALFADVGGHGGLPIKCPSSTARWSRCLETLAVARPSWRPASLLIKYPSSTWLMPVPPLEPWPRRAGSA